MDMYEESKPGLPRDSLEVVERIMAMEEAIERNPSLTPAERERLIREIRARFERGEFDGEDDLDDDALAILVEKLGPRSPRGQAGAAAKPEDAD
jgi:hypothetical protein